MSFTAVRTPGMKSGSLLTGSYDVRTQEINQSLGVSIDSTHGLLQI